MIRTIIKIDEAKCDGCGVCVTACHEGAIALVDGKAKLMREDYCDGLGNCLVCPTGAISFEEREALPFDEKAVAAQSVSKPLPLTDSGCPGSKTMAFQRQPIHPMAQTRNTKQGESELMQWPIQIKLVPTNAPYFHDADLLVAADCTAFSYTNFHQDFIKNHITLIGCPKLDNTDYSLKLTEILANNMIKSVKIVRMQVPCCGGIEYAVKQALSNCGKSIPCKTIVISTSGEIL